MPINVTMPALSPTMTEGILARWLVKEGDTVSSGDVIAEIETDKATMELEAVEDGTIARILVDAPSQAIPVNDPIAILLEDGEDISDIKLEKSKSAPSDSDSSDSVSSGSVSSDENSQPDKSDSASKSVSSQTVAPSTEVISESKGISVDHSGGSSQKRLRISPLARRLAQEKGVEISALKGTGPHGRIIKVDVMNAFEKGSSALSSSATAVGKTKAHDGVSSAWDDLDPPMDVMSITAMRKIIAERLTHSKQTVPHYYLASDVVLDRLMDLRVEVNANVEKSQRISVNDILLKALAMALVEVPMANVQWSLDGMKIFHRVDVSVAVALDQGLITPIVRGAERKGVRAISKEVKELVAKAKSNRLAPHEFQGGTVSLSNLGMFSIDQFSAVINPPQAAILAVGAGKMRPIIRDGALAAGNVMTATLALDHRAIDGAVGAQLLAAFQKMVENPAQMIL